MNYDNNTILLLKKTIHDIRSYPEEEWMKIEIFEKYVDDLNKYAKKLGWIEFRFQQFHYSSTGKTINKKGYNSLINHVTLLEGMFDENTNPNNVKSDKSNTNNKRKVFIVHGRDRQAILETENMIRRFNLEPIVLSRMANSGLTLIEKFEKYSSVEYAIVLLTPDDIGALYEPTPNYSFRARQNVIFELGFFYEKLGRNKVCCITKSNVEKPSDIDGIVYLRYSNNIEEVELDLLKELSASQIKVNIFN